MLKIGQTKSIASEYLHKIVTQSEYKMNINESNICASVVWGGVWMGWNGVGQVVSGRGWRWFIYVLPFVLIVFYYSQPFLPEVILVRTEPHMEMILSAWTPTCK